MPTFLEAVINAMLDRSPEEWIGAILVALFLALALSGAHTVCHRWAKDSTMPLVVLAILFNLVAMLFAVGYMQHRGRFGAGPVSRTMSPFSGRRFGGPGSFTAMLAERIFDDADADHDGSLSTDEAVAATTRFVEDIDSEGTGAVNREAMIAALRDRMRSPGPPPSASHEPPASPVRTEDTGLRHRGEKPITDRRDRASG